MTESEIASAPPPIEHVIDVQRWSRTLYSFRTTRPLGYRFKAGQYARLGLPIDGKLLWRPYSITSPPSADFLEYLLVTVPGGAFTEAFTEIAPGLPIHIDPISFGFMTPDRFTDGETLWMIATGTGLGPYMSMLRDPAIWQQFRNLVLVHGVRDTSEFAWASELRALALRPQDDNAARLRLIGAVTRPTENNPGEILHGRITTLLHSGELERAAGVALEPANSRVMLCGNPAMIEDMRTLLHARALKPCRRAVPGQFLTENYW